jgi:hypothetical protein
MDRRLWLMWSAWATPLATLGSAHADERKNGQNDHDQSDKIDDIVHGTVLLIIVFA